MGHFGNGLSLHGSTASPACGVALNANFHPLFSSPLPVHIDILANYGYVEDLSIPAWRWGHCKQELAAGKKMVLDSLLSSIRN